MIILGIDPGYAIVGWGILEYNGVNFKTIAYGAVNTAAGTDFAARLNHIYDSLSVIIAKYKPDSVAIEKLFFQNNQKTAIDVGQARGVIVLAAKKAGLEINEYTPLQVKQSVVGYGRAEKKQVMEMTRMILKLKEVPKPDDTADALAIAICHGHSAGSLYTKIKKG
jgi:crossover junction endodeoxyribonuclease RuvC